MLDNGIREHRRIATHAVQVRALRRVRGTVLLLIVVLLAGVAVQILNSGDLLPT
jgi:hypothetical protein